MNQEIKDQMRAAGVNIEGALERQIGRAHV